MADGKHYKIIEAHTLQQLEDKVNHFIQENWEYYLPGPPSMMRNECYVQALTYYKKGT